MLMCAGMHVQKYWTRTGLVIALHSKLPIRKQSILISIYCNYCLLIKRQYPRHPVSIRRLQSSEVFASQMPVKSLSK